MHKYTGIVLAGGKSSRMGQDKARLMLNGTPMLQSVLNQLETTVDEILVSSNYPEHAVFNKELIYDEYKNQGPLAGIHAGLKKSSFDMNIVLSCDIPYINKTVIEKLKTAYLKSGGTTTIASCAGRLHPLCGVYSKENLEVIEDLLNKKVLKMLHALEFMNVNVLEFEPAYERCFINMNSQEDINF